MSSSAVIPSDTAKPGERRSSSREVLHHYVVLVYFGEDNWGKLTNMSESGMAFEFSRPPVVHERVNFTFQVMGCMPVPQDARVLGESFEAAGEIVWLREFERIAGVQFVDLAEGNRKHIRQWMSFEAANTPAATRPTQPEALPSAADRADSRTLVTPLTKERETVAKAETKESLTEPLTPELLVEPEPEPEARLTAAVPEDPTSVATESDEAELWQPSTRSSPSSHPSAARLTFLVVAGCLAAFLVTVGVRIFMARGARHADAAEGAPGPAAVRELAAATNVASPGPSPAAPPASVSEGLAPFQVEVQDTTGKRWMLWFVTNDSKKGNEQASRRTVPQVTSLAASAAGGTASKDAAATQGPEPSRTFTLEAPNINRAAGDGSAAANPAAEAPAIQTELTVPEGQPIGGALDGRVTPPPPVAHAPVGGMVQMARLIHSVPPVYPSVARASRVSGDVVVDALIDTSGNVKATKVISGPVMLQQAAVETVRQWKYEPARLDGQAVAMHLTVTVKFRVN